MKKSEKRASAAPVPTVAQLEQEFKERDIPQTIQPGPTQHNLYTHHSSSGGGSCSHPVFACFEDLWYVHDAHHD